MELREEEGTTVVRAREHFPLCVPLLFRLLEALYLDRHTDTARLALEKLRSLVEPPSD